MKNFGEISDPKDVVTKEYVEGLIPKLVTASTTVSSESSTITVPFTVSDSTQLIVYHNGVLLAMNINYTYSSNAITLKDYTADIGDVFIFITLST